MIETLSEKITSKFIDSNIIKAEDREIYNYCFEATIVSFISYTTLLLLSLIFREFVCSLIFLISFSVFRKICGGYHAESYLKCAVMSLSSYLILILAVKKFSAIFSADLYLLILGLIIIILLSPVEDKNKPFTEKQYKFFKTISKSLAAIIILIFIILRLGGFKILFINKYYFSFCYGIDLVAFSLLISKIERRFKSAKN